MKTIFDSAARAELIDRVASLDNRASAQWGKMNVFQMVKHNTIWNSWMLGDGEYSYKQEFLGKLFGRIALRKMIKDSKPLDKNIPTSRAFQVQQADGDFDAEKSKWIALLRGYEDYHNPIFVHDFFGKMTRDEIGILVYKHTDHHLRQFGA